MTHERIKELRALCDAATPGEWGLVKGNDHHGPYIEACCGGTIADFYMMSDTSSLSIRNGGTSRPIWFMPEEAQANAALAAASRTAIPDLLDEVERLQAELKSVLGRETALRARHSEIVAEYTEALNHIEHLREALRPFVEQAKSYDDGDDDYSDDTPLDCADFINVGDLRRARAALEGKDGR